MNTTIRTAAPKPGPVPTLRVIDDRPWSECPTCRQLVTANRAEALRADVDASLERAREIGFVVGGVSAAVLIFVLLLALRSFA